MPQVMSSYSLKCAACGRSYTFRTDAAEGEVAWAQCPACGDLAMAHLPGDRKGRAPRPGTEAIYQAIFDIFDRERPPLTVRQVYYQLAVGRFVPKSQKGYRTAQYHLATLRRGGVLPYEWLADNTRWTIRAEAYQGLDSAMAIWHEAYRRDLWAKQAENVEIWVEKDAIAGVLEPITRKYQAPLYVARGFSSMTFAYQAAESIRRLQKPTVVYHFGDFDPSGQNAAHVLQRELDKHGARASFVQAAVTLEQVQALDLPTLPVNRKDPRAPKWPHNFVVELEAYPAQKLRDLVEECIVQHIDTTAWARVKVAESLERETLDKARYFVQEQQSGLAAQAAA